METLLFDILGWLTLGMEVAGVAAIVSGSLFAGWRFIGDWRSPVLQSRAYHRFRSGLGRSILLGLELLVAADIINTVSLEPTLERLAVLAGIVLIRTFLSLSLEVEIDGRWPWQRGPDGRE